MGNIKLEIHDGGEAKDTTAPVIKQDFRKYRVTAEAGLFKNGRSYAHGDEIELERKAALNFMAVNEVEEI